VILTIVIQVIKSDRFLFFGKESLIMVAIPIKGKLFEFLKPNRTKIKIFLVISLFPIFTIFLGYSMWIIGVLYCLLIGDIFFVFVMWVMPELQFIDIHSIVVILFYTLIHFLYCYLISSILYYFYNKIKSLIVWIYDKYKKK